MKQICRSIFFKLSLPLSFCPIICLSYFEIIIFIQDKFTFFFYVLYIFLVHKTYPILLFLNKSVSPCFRHFILFLKKISVFILFYYITKYLPYTSSTSTHNPLPIIHHTVIHSYEFFLFQLLLNPSAPSCQHPLPKLSACLYL